MIVGRKGEGTSPPKMIPGMECLHISTRGAKRPWKGPISGLKGPIRTRLGRFKSPTRQKKITNSEKEGGGMVEVGRRKEVASPPKPIVGSKRSCPKINNNSNSENGSGGIWWWVGRDGDTSPLKPMPGSERS